MPKRLVAVSVVAAAFLVWAGAASAVADFVTPRKAAYCGVSEGEPPLRLICWRPLDGLTLDMTRRGRVQRRLDSPNRGYYDPASGRVLRFGQTWTLPASWRCVSRSTGLTCTNRSGHGLLAGAAAWFSVVLTRSAQPRAAGVAAERGVHVGAASWRKATHQAPSTLPCAGDRLARFPGKRDRAAAAFWVVALDIAADVLAATESRDCRSLAERRQRLRGRHLSVLPRRADALAHIDLGLAHPLTERLRAEAEPARSLRPTCPARGAGAPPPPGTPACTSTDDLS